MFHDRVSREEARRRARGEVRFGDRDVAFGASPGSPPLQLDFLCLKRDIPHTQVAREPTNERPSGHGTSVLFQSINKVAPEDSATGSLTG